MSQGVTEGEALDIIEKLVLEDQGTDDPKLRGIRHALHRAGRLNEPVPTTGPFIVLTIHEGFPSDPSAFDIHQFTSWREATREAKYHRRSGGVAVIRRPDARQNGEWHAMRLNKHESSTLVTGESELN